MGDKGCKVALLCLECPLSKCKYDLGVRAQEKASRDSQMLQAYGDGVRVSELALRFAVEERTVYRILGRARRARSV